jgi:hypothetical protein
MRFEIGNNGVFVFGSNTAGVHGAGAAKTAFEFYGAVKGQGAGRMGHAYGIPTRAFMDSRLSTLPLPEIVPFIDEFLEHARSEPGLTFYVTRIGCGLAGYPDDVMADLFKDAPENCLLPGPWLSRIRPGAPERLVFAGSRGIGDESVVFPEIGKMLVVSDGRATVIVSGLAQGPDTLGARFARKECLHVDEFPAQWGSRDQGGFGKAAGHLRNTLMAGYATRALLFWDGASPGTRHMLKTVKDFGIPFRCLDAGGRVLEVSGLAASCSGGQGALQFSFNIEPERVTPTPRKSIFRIPR